MQRQWSGAIVAYEYNVFRRIRIILRLHANLVKPLEISVNDSYRGFHERSTKRNPTSDWVNRHFICWGRTVLTELNERAFAQGHLRSGK
jgi:hypothetical protein